MNVVSIPPAIEVDPRLGELVASRSNCNDDLKGLLETWLTRFFGLIAGNVPTYQAFRKDEFSSRSHSQSEYGTYFQMLAGQLGFADPVEERIFLLSLFGAATFVATKEILWDRKPGVDTSIVEKLSRILVHGIAGPSASPSLQDTFSYDRFRLSEPPPLQRFDRKRSRILNACEKSFGRLGYEACSIDEICERANVSVGVFYSIFRSKEDAFRSLTLQLRSQLVRGAIQASEQCKSRLETEMLALAAFFKFIQRHRAGYRLLREAEFLNLEIAKDYYIIIFQNYAEMMKQQAIKDEFLIEDYALLALAMMGIGHMLGLGFAVWERNRINTPLFQAIVRSVFYGTPPFQRLSPAKSH